MKAGAPPIKRKYPFVKGDITVLVLTDDCKRITGFKVTLGGKEHIVPVKTSILIAWKEVETKIEKYLSTTSKK